MTRSSIYNIIIIFALLIGISLTGCTNYTTGETDPKPGDLSLSFDTIHTNQSGFFARGDVRLEVNVNDSARFTDVTLCTYDENGSVVSGQTLGTLMAPNDTRSFRLKAPERPMYVVVDHPQFGDYTGMGPVVFVWSDYYQQYREENRDALPFNYRFDHPVGDCPKA